MADKLQDLRQEIDRLDDEILTALCSRWRLSSEIIAAKNGQNAFRPGREADVISRLASAAPDIDSKTILGIWRQIFSASIAQQENHIQIAVHGDVLPAAIWHFGSAMDVRINADMNATLLALDNGAHYAMVPTRLGDDIAGALAVRDDLFIIAETPLYEVNAVDPAFIIGPHMADQSGNDDLLYAVAGQNGVSLQRRDRQMIASQNGGSGQSADNGKLIGMVAR